MSLLMSSADGVKLASSRRNSAPTARPISPPSSRPSVVVAFRSTLFMVPLLLRASSFTRAAAMMALPAAPELPVGLMAPLLKPSATRR